MSDNLFEDSTPPRPTDDDTSEMAKTSHLPDHNQPITEAPLLHRLWMPEVAEESPPPPPRRPWIRNTAIALIVPLLIGTGVLVGRLTTDDDASTNRPLPSAQEQPNVAPPVTNPGDEPVAAVAAALLPSVVQLETQTGLGSGVIYDSDGYILTAAHVVDGSTEVTVRLSDGSSLEGTVVGTDESSDIAVVKVEETGLQEATLAIGIELQVGQLAIAIGSPFGLDSTVTSGIVSAVNRGVVRNDGTVANMVQTDASINPGNSGGALVDREGRVIGINDSIQSQSGGNEGVGFAVPIDQAAWVADQLVAGKPVIPAFLGVSGTNDSAGRAGALITSVEPDSAADDAGIENGDLIIKVDNVTIESMTALAGLVRATPPGTEVTITILRDGDTITLTATLGDRSTES